jgi:septal ring factor EnvC (AmiA/AmiB activator)
MTNSKHQLINEKQLQKDRTQLKNLVETINALAYFGTPTSLTEAVRLMDQTEQLLMNYCHKLQAARADMRFAIDQLHRNQ